MHVYGFSTIEGIYRLRSLENEVYLKAGKEENICEN